MNRPKKITLEIERHMVVRRKTHSRAKLFCELCPWESEMLTVKEMAFLVGCDPYAILGWIRFGWLHSMPTNEGLPLVCRNSLEGIITIK